VYARAWTAADSINARVRLSAENDRLQEECALLREELRIKLKKRSFSNGVFLANRKQDLQNARMIGRRIKQQVTDALDRQAAVALIGPRQVGKTTRAGDW